MHYLTTTYYLLLKNIYKDLAVNNTLFYAKVK
jgi:hypothetical protein